MICYHVTLLLWALTIVGGFYKAYQYAMVPYLVAENPRITWGEARALSTRMTDGYKRRMLVVHLSYLPIFLLQAVPVLGLLVVVPLEAELGAELYFTLRGNPALDRELFVEPAFDGVPYVLRPADERAGSAPAYLLADLDIERPHAVRGPLPYPVVDLVYCFFAFCCAGWVWEVALHFVQEHEWVNRGTLYGPWIPIYGVGGVGIIVLLDRYRKSPERLFFLAMALCAVLEYVCSWLLDFMFNTSYWDYDGMLFNVNGRICLAGLLAFGLGGLFGVYVAAPAISRKVGSGPSACAMGWPRRWSPPLWRPRLLRAARLQLRLRRGREAVGGTRAAAGSAGEGDAHPGRLGARSALGQRPTATDGLVLVSGARIVRGGRPCAGERDRCRRPPTRL